MAKVDAVIIPSGYKDHPDVYVSMAQLTLEFAPILGLKPGQGIYVSDLGGGRQQFLRGKPELVWGFASGHPRHGESQFDWTERPEGDGVLYGTLITEEPTSKEPIPDAP